MTIFKPDFSLNAETGKYEHLEAQRPESIDLYDTFLVCDKNDPEGTYKVFTIEDPMSYYAVQSGDFSGIIQTANPKDLRLYKVKNAPRNLRPQ
jgi:hypothetical protein